MNKIRAIVGAAGATFAACLWAQTPVPGYPSKPIRAVIPFTAGSATDILGRLIAPKLHDSWGQQ